MWPKKRYCHWFTAQRGHRLESWDRIRHEGRRCLTLLLGFEALHKSNKQTTAWLQGRGSETVFSQSTRLNIWLWRWTLHNYLSALFMCTTGLRTMCTKPTSSECCYVTKCTPQVLLTHQFRGPFTRFCSRRIVYIHLFRLKPEAKHLSRETDAKGSNKSTKQSLKQWCKKYRFWMSSLDSPEILHPAVHLGLKTASHAWKQNQRETHDTDYFFFSACTDGRRFPAPHGWQR